MSTNEMKVVYTVVERAPGRSAWTKIGVGFINRDGSMNLKLDALPLNGTLQVRDWEERDAMRRPQEGQDGQDAKGPAQARSSGGRPELASAAPRGTPPDASGGLA